MWDNRRCVEYKDLLELSETGIFVLTMRIPLHYMSVQIIILGQNVCTRNDGTLRLFYVSCNLLLNCFLWNNILKRNWNCFFFFNIARTHIYIKGLTFISQVKKKSVCNHVCFSWKCIDLQTIRINVRCFENQLLQKCRKFL